MYKLPLYIGFAALLAAQTASAVTVTSSASVEIIKPSSFEAQSEFESLTINQDEIINSVFKHKISRKNKSDKQQVYVQDLPDSNYKFSSMQADTIHINVSSANNDSGVNIDDFKVNFKGRNLSSDIAYEAPGRNANITLSAKLKINSDANAGFHSPEFEVAVLYE